MAKNITTCDVCIVGAGLVGQTAAIALARQGYEVILCAPAKNSKDNRTTALLMDSVDYLNSLELWDQISQNAYPLKTMRIVDGSERMIRAPQTDFNSSEIDLDAFGYNVQNDEFSAVLTKHMDKENSIHRIEGVVESINSENEHSLIIINSKNTQISIEAGFIVGADGKNSFIRQNMQAGEREWEYPQTAIVVDFKHQHPTRYISTEFHTETGPFTIVPRSENMAGLVWMEKPERAEELAALEKDDLALVIERQMQSYLGKIEIVSDVQAYPLKGLVAKQFGKDNWALIGEAAHVFPPIGAQGFNLGVRDIKSLCDVLGRYTSAENLGDKYDGDRKIDVNVRTYGVDALNRSLLSSFLPIHALRSLGLHVLREIPFIRKTVMKMGIAPKYQTNQ